MKALLAATGALALLAAAPSPVLAQEPAPARVEAENPAFAALLSDYEAWLKANDPISAGMDGDVAARSRLPDASREAELARRAPLQAFKARAEAIDPSDLTPADAQNRAFVLFLLNRDLEGIGLDTGRLALNSEGAVSQNLAYLASVTRIANRADADAWLARLRGMPALYDDTLVNARRGMATGMVQARSVVDSAIALARTDAALTPDTDPLMAPFKTLPASIPAADQAALRAEAAAVIAEQIMPRRSDWLSFLIEEYLPVSADTPGVGQRPGGRDLYAYFVRGYTTTDLTPDQVHAIGLEEVARIRARMDEEMRAAGWTGDFAGFLAFLRSDPQFYATSREDLLEKASEMAKRADDHLPALFGTLPACPTACAPCRVTSKTATPRAAISAGQ
jgi:uncharacterized protein (DUF885 family)